MSGVLIDTTVLIPAYQANGDVRAKDVLEDLALRGDGCLSIQSFTEFARILGLRLTSPVPVAKVRDTILQLEQVFDVLRPTSRTIARALHGVEKHGLPFWDAMIWAVAHENGVAEILTADPPPQAEIEGVRYRNPFA
jgi:predicted nucleic acid-binding protein